MVKMNQVIGRARRNNSHTALPAEQRNVRVYEYIGKFSDGQLGKGSAHSTQPLGETLQGAEDSKGAEETKELEGAEGAKGAKQPAEGAIATIESLTIQYQKYRGEIETLDQWNHIRPISL